MEQITSGLTQTCGTARAAEVRADEGVVSEFERQAKNWREKQNTGDITGNDNAMSAPMAAEPPLQLKVVDGSRSSRTGLGRIDGSKKGVDRNGSAITRETGGSKLVEAGRKSGLTAKDGNDLLKKIGASKFAEVTAVDMQKAVAGNKADDTTAQTNAAGPVAVRALRMESGPAAAMPLSNDSTQAGSSVAADAMVVKKKTEQESSPNAQLLPPTDTRGGQDAMAQSGRSASQAASEQFAAPRQPSPRMQAQQDDALRGTEFTYRFSKWGSEHAVKVQAQTRGYTPQLTLQPSDQLVALRLDHAFSQSAPSDHWTLLKDGEQREDGRTPWHTDDEEEGA
jgi:hypothetical protein